MDVNDTCDIIRDLIPGYVDEVLSKAGTEAVKTHLEQCEECRSVYEAMKGDMKLDTEEAEEEALVLDGFKKIERRTKRLKLAIVVVSGLLITIVFAVFLRMFVIGEPLGTHQIQVSDLVYDEETERLRINGTVNFSGYHISRVLWQPSEENVNEVNVIVYAAESLPFARENNTFSIEIPNMKGRKAYLACPEYDRLEVYSWKTYQYELPNRLEEEIYNRIPGWDIARDILEYSGGITTVGGEEGISYFVSYVTGEGAVFWRFNEQIITDGDLEPADFQIWISLEEPHRIQIYDYQTGEWNDNYSIVTERRPKM